MVRVSERSGGLWLTIAGFSLAVATTALADAQAPLSSPLDDPTTAVEAAEPEPALPLEAVAVVHDAKGSALAGTVVFKHAGDALAVKAEIGGLVPGATYRLHIHEYGDCSALRANSAGDVFGEAKRLVVFVAGDDGWVDLAFSHRGHVLDRSDASVLGRSVVIHRASESEGCGTIGLARRAAEPTTKPVPANLD